MRGDDTRGRAQSAATRAGVQAGEPIARTSDAELHASLAAQDIFAEAPPREIEALLEHCEIRRLQPAELLLARGENSDYLYILLDGKLGIYLERREDDSDPDFVVEPGEYVGEISIIDGQPATAFVCATEPSTLLAVPERRFWLDFLGHPQIARNFMRLFAERFRSRNKMMQRSLEERLRYEHLERELGIAEEIQAGMLPHDPDLLPEIDIVAKMTAARRVGGDFYDVFAIDDNKFCIAIGDVSGKGVPASLFMVKAMTLLRTEMLRSANLEAAVQRLNEALCSGNERCMFVTMIVGTIDRASGEFRYVCAGHNPMVFGDRGRDFRFLPAPPGIVAGVISEDAGYEAATITLQRGDVLVFYTDGVTEAMNGRRELFTETRLLNCLAGEPDASATTIAARVDSAVTAFVDGAPPSDDLTVVVLRYLG